MRTRAVAAVLLLTACKPSWEEIRAAGEDELRLIRPGLEERVALLAKLGAQATAAPEAQPAIELGSRPKLHFGGYEGTNANVLHASAADLARTEVHAQAGPLEFRSYPLQKAREILAGYLFEGEQESIEAARAQVRGRVERVTKARYLVVLRQLELVEPKMNSFNAEGFKPNSDAPIGTYLPGSFRGDLVLFDLEDQSLLGALPIHATTPDSIEVRGNLSWLTDGLYTPLRAEIVKALKTISDDEPVP
jgi:hypothetical protein